MYNPSGLPYNHCPHAFIYAPSANIFTSAMPPLVPTLSFMSMLITPLITCPTMMILFPLHPYTPPPPPLSITRVLIAESPPPPPLSITPLSDLLLLNFRCYCCPIYPTPHLSASVSSRFPFLPLSSYCIYATTFSIIPRVSSTVLATSVSIIPALLLKNIPHGPLLHSSLLVLHYLL